MRKLLLLLFMLPAAIAALAAARGDLPLDTLRHWDHVEATGDMNGDGVADLAIIAGRGHGHPVLAVYWGQKKGGYTLFKQWHDVVPSTGDNDHHVDHSVAVDKQGVMRITISAWSSAGSYGTSTTTYVFRYRQGDFYLIGRDVEEMMRNSGDCTTTSYNYLTGKKSITTGNAFNKKVKPRKQWSNAPVAALRRLGDCHMEP